MPSSPGIFSFSASNYRINQYMSNVFSPTTIAYIKRINGTQGPATVPVTLSSNPGTATENIDYHNTFPLDITFADGQKLAPVIVPIYQHGKPDFDKSLNLVLGQPTGTIVPTGLGGITSATSLFNNSARREFNGKGTIILPDTGAGSIYPYNIEVHGLKGHIKKVIARLKNFTHNFPSDIAIVLVSPSGKTITLSSGAGGGGFVPGVQGVYLTFDQDAPEKITKITSGTYKPTNFYDYYLLPAPCPPRPTGIDGAGDPYLLPYVADLNVYVGEDPNGTWLVYAADCANPAPGQLSGDKGYISGVSLAFELT